MDHPPNPKPLPEYKFPAMIAIPSSAPRAIGAMSTRPITRLEFAIGVMPFIVNGVMKWINVRIVGRLFVEVVERFAVVNSAGVDCVKIVRLLADGTFLVFDYHWCFLLFVSVLATFIISISLTHSLTHPCLFIYIYLLLYCTGIDVVLSCVKEMQSLP